MGMGEYTVTGYINGVEHWLQFGGRQRDGRARTLLKPSRHTRVAGVTRAEADRIVDRWSDLGLKVVPIDEAPTWKRARKNRVL